MQDNYVSLWACALWQITVSKELKSWKKGVRINMSRRNFSSKKRNISDCFDTFFEEQKRNWRLLFNSFCTRCCWIIVWREFLKEASLNFFAEKVARGNSVQTGLDFPAKSLSIYTSNDLLQAMNMEKWIISTNKVVEFQC